MSNTIFKILTGWFFATLLCIAAHAQWNAECALPNFTSVPGTTGCGFVAYNPSAEPVSGGGTKTSGPFTVTAPSSVPPGNNPVNLTVVFNPSTFGVYSGNIQFSYSFYTLTVILSATYEATSVFYPAYQVTSIIYAPPGNKSQGGYTDTTTDGTTTTVGSSFTEGSSMTFSGGFGDCSVGCFSASASFGTSATTSNSKAFTETYTDATGVANASTSTNPDAINHNLDLFLIWLDPQVTVVGVPPTPSSYSVGIQPAANGNTPLPDILEVEALVMEPNAAGKTTVPEALLNQQYNPATEQYTPGLAAICKNLKTVEYTAGTCTLADQCGCVASDFAPILRQDLLLYSNGTSKPLSPYSNTASPLLADTSGETTCGVLPVSTTNSCRYVPVPSAHGSTTQEIETLTGPDCQGCGGSPNTFTQGENQSTTVTQGQQSAETVSVSIKGGITAFSMMDTNTWTWTQSQSVGTTTGSGVSETVTLNTSTVGCNQDIPLYEDTVYHTFVFQQPGGSQGASCTTATAKPTFSPAAGTYSEEQTVTISTPTSGATIYYTTNGSTPTTASTAYTTPITVSSTETVKAISYFPGWATSSVGSAAYTIE
jgi:hypothetical protein